MPSTATITAFYTFAPNTKARASEVNTNFSIFRGHIISLSPTTETFSDDTYDLGASNYRWRTSYLRDIDLLSSTSTGAAVQIVGDTSYTAGACLIKIGGTTRLRVDDTGFDGANLKLSSVSITALSSRGTAFTTAADVGQLANSGIFATGMAGSAGVYNIPGSTLTISTAGRPVYVTLINNGTDNEYTIARTTAVDAATVGSTIEVIRDGSVIDYVAKFRYQMPGVTTSSLNGGQSGISWPLTMSYIRIPDAGAHTYYVRITNISAANTTYSIKSALQVCEF